ncbi:retrovirus-related Pol polyprotein from transposon 297 [Trichonephila clavipes]|nr:retrovirus-related Pol polyprotein from transposon 297 [Trichonephila clavipes]
MDSLARQIQELSLQVAELTRERNSSRHQRYSSDRRRSHSRSRSVNRGSGICYYHRRYKEQARKCVSPCAFVQKTNSGSEICVIPPSPTMNKSPQSNFSLFAANNTKIPAYDLSKVPGVLPLHVVPKSDSTVRPVGDYRQLNSVTEFDRYPMPYLNDFAHALHGKRIFSKINIFKAFHQIPIAECDIPKTAVTTPWGLYEYTHLCFGLVNAPQTFMRFMHEVLRGLLFCFVYLDDILCYSENAEEHRSHLRTIFQRLSSYGLKLNISRCVFNVTELIFFGHFITPDGIKPLPDKVQAVLDYKQPETVGSLRKFLGLLNFYRRFLPKAAEQQYLLSEFLKGSKGKKDSKPLNWSSETITAFQRCKQALADAALLAHHSPSAPLALHVDASDYAIGGAHQVVDSELQPLAFFFQKTYFI